MSLARYLTHPQVRIDPSTPVPKWGLSDVGGARTHAICQARWLRSTTSIVSSGERKAIETAEILAKACNVTIEVRHAMHENDRTATGFLNPPEFEATADQFFAKPLESVRGWERAIDAQQRIVREIDAVLALWTSGGILFVGHGAVGTLLYCHYAGVPIDRRHDQPAGGGNVFTFEIATRTITHGWRPMEADDA
jgi:broad specificity phosphatase PhoE